MLSKSNNFRLSSTMDGKWRMKSENTSISLSITSTEWQLSMKRLSLLTIAELRGEKISNLMISNDLIICTTPPVDSTLRNSEIDFPQEEMSSLEADRILFLVLKGIGEVTRELKILFHELKSCK
jgi:hypothetical protein